jgi:small-conductance mechanosensitive channel/CRP-like cAMP-binding protein
MIYICGVLILSLVSMLALRRRPLRWRLLADGALLALYSGTFWLEGANPLLLVRAGITIPDGPWEKALAIGWWVLAARLLAVLLRLFLGHDKRSREARLLSDLLSGSIYIGTLLIVLDFVLKLPIGGILATSGVFAIVLGLALQNTLADVFSGIAVGVEQPFHVGDRIKLGDRIEGRVVEVNWRSIRLQTDEDDVAIVPNSAVAKAEIVNRSFPTVQRNGKVEIACTALAAPSQISTLLREAALLCPEILPHPVPRVLLTRLGERTNGYAMIFSVADPNEFGHAKSALLEQMRRLLHHAGLLLADRGKDGARPGPAGAADMLRQTIVFESLTEEQIAHLAERVEYCRLEAGSVLFTEGEVDATLYIVADGVLEIARALPDGTAETLGRIGVGDYIGEIGLLTGAARAVTAKAITNACVHVLRKDAVAPLLASEPAVAAAFEQSVKRGMTLLHRDVVARVDRDDMASGQLLARIRSYFRF